MSRLKQAFYENHAGGSITEVNRITATILVGHILYLTLARCRLVQSTTDKISWGFVCYFFNVLLAITVYSDRHRSLLLLYIIPATFLALQQRSRPDRTPGVDKVPRPENGVPKTGDQKESTRQKVAFLSVYRATMMITTILSILAVDLPIFPRRYAKTETWGTSLMDLGVGSFVFSSGVVSSRQRSSVVESLRQGGIVLAMGIMRALMVRGTGYHEHVSEYGVHWNFFITLSLLPPLLPLFRRVQSRGIPFIVQGVILCIIYQVLLLQTGWQAWVIGAYRDGIFSANKEGISSFVGYTAIFLLGLDAGCMILSKKSRPIIVLLCCSGVAYSTGYLFTSNFLMLRVSRRIANSPYIMWVAAHNTTFLAALAIAEKFATRLFSSKNSRYTTSVPTILNKINNRGLYVFLGANLLTGAINLLLGDAMMTMGTFAGLAIMLAYGMSIVLLVMLL